MSNNSFIFQSSKLVEDQSHNHNPGADRYILLYLKKSVNHITSNKHKSTRVLHTSQTHTLIHIHAQTNSSPFALCHTLLHTPPLCDITTLTLTVRTNKFIRCVIQKEPPAMISVTESSRRLVWKAVPRNNLGLYQNLCAFTEQQPNRDTNILKCSTILHHGNDCS